MLAASDYDLIILGGGLVGLTAALLCAKQNLKVALVEGHTPSFEWDQSTFDFRCSAISRASEMILRKAGVWDTIEGTRVSPYKTMFVWDAIGFGELNFDAESVAETDLGHIIENRVILKSLWDKINHHDNIFLFCPRRSTQVEIVSDKVQLWLDDGSSITAKLIVGADGAKSWLRQKMHFDTKTKDYHQSALVATVTTTLPHEATARQRFLPEGPLAFLPLSPPNTSSIVWTGTRENTEKRRDLSEEEFKNALAQAFDYKLGNILSVFDRHIFPLSRLHAKHYVKERVALIGDALHVVHPLAGQGLNLGFLDAEMLAQVLGDGKRKDYDIGHFLLLRRFERARKSQVMMMMTALEFFNRIFKYEETFVVGARGLGMDLINQTPWLKKEIILRAMGLK